MSRLAFLREALASIDSQTTRDFEVVIGDNSADAAYATAVDSLVATDFAHLSVRVFHHPRDLGMLGNCNFLVDAAHGDYWLYLPDDDRLCPRALEVLAGALDAEPRAGLAFADHYVMNAEGVVDVEGSARNSRRYGRDVLRAGFHPRASLYDLALRQVFELQSMMFRSAVIRALRFRDDSFPVPDLDLELRLASCGELGGAVYCAARLNEYRHHGAQWTVAVDHRNNHRAIIASLLRSAPSDARARPVYRRKLAFHYATLATLEAEAGEGAAARRAALSALRTDPLAPKSLAALVSSVAPAQLVRRARSIVHEARRRLARGFL